MPLLGYKPLCRSAAERRSLEPCPQTCSGPLWRTEGITPRLPVRCQNINSNAASFFYFKIYFLHIMCQVDLFQGVFGVVHLCIRIIGLTINGEQDFLPSGLRRLIFARASLSIAPTSPASFRLRLGHFHNSASLPISTCVSVCARLLCHSGFAWRTMTPRRRTRTSDMAVSGRRHVEALVSHQNSAERGKSFPRAPVCLSVCLPLTSEDLGGRGLEGGQVSERPPPCLCVGGV